MRFFATLLVLMAALCNSVQADVCEQTSREIYTLLMVKLKSAAYDQYQTSLKNVQSEDDRKAIYSRTDLCNSPQIVSKIRMVYTSKQELCRKNNKLTDELQWFTPEIKGPDKNSLSDDQLNKYLQEAVTKSVKGIASELSSCSVDESQANSVLNFIPPKNSMNLSPIQACQVAQKMLNHTVSLCQQTVQSAKSIDPTSCEIVGPDGLCPGAPKPQATVKPLSAQDMRDIDFLTNGSTLQQRRKRLLNQPSVGR